MRWNSEKCFGGAGAARPCLSKVFAGQYLGLRYNLHTVLQQNWSLQALAVCLGPQWKAKGRGHGVLGFLLGRISAPCSACRFLIILRYLKPEAGAL